MRRRFLGHMEWRRGCRSMPWRDGWSFRSMIQVDDEFPEEAGDVDFGECSTL